jgi:hypothetical protein
LYSGKTVQGSQKNNPKMMKRIFYVVLVTMAIAACKPEKKNYDTLSGSILIEGNKTLSDAIITDIFTPPVASRIYSYSNIAAYEALVSFFPNYKSFHGQLKDFPAVPKIDDNKEYDPELVAISAFTTVAKKLVYSEQVLADFQAKKEKEYGSKVSSSIVKNSVEYGNSVGAAILGWASKDNYTETRNMMRYVIGKGVGEWIPTPPDYMSAVEPHWGKIRSLSLVKANEFMINNPLSCDSIKDSEFMKASEEVMNIGKNLTPEQVEIAKFWDDNPNISHHFGHMTYDTQKLTPGGHWIGISTIALKDKKAGLMQSAETYALVTTSLLDGFIACWDEKYRCRTVRPETIINKYLDQDWRPLLQTPPFPEYPSGHGTISASAATVLTHLFGADYAFTDSTEVEFGFPPRKFKSFYEASDEAALSRLYGGIHYRHSNDDARALGRKIGNNLMSKILTRTNPVK